MDLLPFSAVLFFSRLVAKHPAGERAGGGGAVARFSSFCFCISFQWCRVKNPFGLVKFEPWVEWDGERFSVENQEKERGVLSFFWNEVLAIVRAKALLYDMQGFLPCFRTTLLRTVVAS